VFWPDLVRLHTSLQVEEGSKQTGARQGWWCLCVLGPRNPEAPGEVNSSSKGRVSQVGFIFRLVHELSPFRAATASSWRGVWIVT
jgi:hypothetical protein